MRPLTVWLLLVCLPRLASAVTLSATPATFRSQLAQMRAGDTLLLASGTYPALDCRQGRVCPRGTFWAGGTGGAAPGEWPPLTR